MREQGCPASIPLRAPGPARPQCPGPRKPGLMPGPVTSSLPGGRSGENKAGFVPLPRTEAGCDPARGLGVLPEGSTAPPVHTSPWDLGGGGSSCVPECRWVFSCREQISFISFGSQAWEAPGAGCFHTWVTRHCGRAGLCLHRHHPVPQFPPWCCRDREPPRWQPPRAGWRRLCRVRPGGILQGRGFETSYCWFPAGHHGAATALGWGMGFSCSWRLSPLPSHPRAPLSLRTILLFPWIVDADAAGATQHVKPLLLRSCIPANTF